MLAWAYSRLRVWRAQASSARVTRSCHHRVDAAPHRIVRSGGDELLFLVDGSVVRRARSSVCPDSGKAMTHVEEIGVGEILDADHETRGAKRRRGMGRFPASFIRRVRGVERDDRPSAPPGLASAPGHTRSFVEAQSAMGSETNCETVREVCAQLGAQQFHDVVCRAIVNPVTAGNRTGGRSSLPRPTWTRRIWHRPHQRPRCR